MRCVYRWGKRAVTAFVIALARVTSRAEFVRNDHVAVFCCFKLLHCASSPTVRIPSSHNERLDCWVSPYTADKSHCAGGISSAIVREQCGRYGHCSHLK